MDEVGRRAGQRSARFVGRYREHVSGASRSAGSQGPGVVEVADPEWDDVAVGVVPARREPRRAGVERHTIEGFLDQPEARVVVLVGPPGSGKSIALRRVARRACQEGRGRRRPVPILLDLGEHAATIAADPAVDLADLARATLDGLAADEPSGWFEQRLASGGCVVLLDGVDGAAGPEDRRRVADWVRLQVERHRRNDFVVTARPRGHREAPLRGAIVLRTRPLTPDQVRAFAHQWYRVVERRAGGPGADVDRRAAEAAEDLLGELAGAPGVAADPLVLTMLANLHRRGGALPGSRVEVCAETCRVVLRHAGVEAVGAPLGALAFRMMTEGVRESPRAVVLAELGSGAALVGAGAAGLLVERGRGRFRFAHHILQEYLAAEHIRREGLVGVLAARVDDVWWRETTLLHCALSDAGPVVEACLASGSTTALSLAFECLDRDAALAPNLRRRVERLLTPSAARDGDPGLRGLVAEVLARRHLSSRVTTSAGSVLCREPVPAELVELYRLDGHPGPAWLLPQEVDRFLGWAREVAGAVECYRLPTPEEVEDPAVRPGLGQAHVWVRDGGCVPALWSAGPHPHRIGGKRLADELLRDLTRARLPLGALLVDAMVLAHLLAPLLGADAGQPQREVARALCGRLVPVVERARALSDGGLAAQAAKLASAVGAAVESGRPDSAQVDVRALRSALYRVFDEVTGARGHSVLVRPSDGVAWDFLPFDRDPAASISDLRGRLLHRWAGVAMTRALDGAPLAGTWPSAFVRPLFGLLAPGDDVELAVSPYALPALMESLHARTAGVWQPGIWASQARGRLIRTVGSLLRGTAEDPAVAARGARLLALCLAVEAESVGDPDAAGSLRLLAGGVALLEQRVNGTAPPRETVVPAVDAC